MLPIVDKPLIQYAVEEAYTAGIRQMVFVTGRTKRAVENHLDSANELESMLEYSQKQQLLEAVRDVTPDDMYCIYVRQARALGLGHAILCTERIIGDEDFAVILADDFMIAEKPVMTQIVEQFQQLQSSIIAVQDVPKSQTSFYGIVDGLKTHTRMLKINTIIEKPLPDESPSTLGVVGRYILSPAIFDKLKKQQPGINGEIQLTNGIAILLKKEAVFSYRFNGKHYDCDNKIDYLKAVVDLASNHPEVSESFNQWLTHKVHKRSTVPAFLN